MWGFIPDAWHHQMIYACELDCIYLTNPLEIKTVDTIMKELTSESVLLVRNVDVIKRFNANNVNLVDLLNMENCSLKERKRWFDLNVIGQCVNVLREAIVTKTNEDSQNDAIESRLNFNFKSRKYRKLMKEIRVASKIGKTYSISIVFIPIAPPYRTVPSYSKNTKNKNLFFCHRCI